MTRTNSNTITGPQYGAPREMPWNVMGHDLKPSSATNLGKALKDAGLDYQVESWKVKAQGPGRVTISADRNQAIVRPMPAGTMKVVGVTGKRFTPVQNADAFSIATDLVGDFGAKIAGLADFRHGGASILSLALPDQAIQVVNRHARGADKGHVDLTDLYLLVKNHHDGSGALSFALTPVRVDCTNVLPVAVKGAVRVWKINHTPNAQERVDLAKAAVREAIGFHDALQVTAQGMLDTKMVDAEFAKIVANMIPVKDDATGAVADRKREAQAVLVHLYQNSPTLEGIRGTVWGGYNAVTEYLDHFRPVKGDPTLARAEGQIDGPNVRVKARLWDTFSAAAA